MLSLENIEFLLLVATLVALLARRLRLPYTVGLVVAGTALASIGVFNGFTFTKELIFRVLLPPLIFEAAFFIRWKELRQNFTPVFVLASLGVLASSLMVGAAMVYIAGWPWPIAAVFGALIAATDPVSVIAMFKEMKVGGRLRLLVESESLFNDGVAAVLFSVALLWATGTTLTVGITSLTLLREVGGGILCGAVVAGAALFLAGRTEDHLLEIAFTTVTAFGSFILAEHFHCSGVLAVLIAGLMIGNLGHIGAITDIGRDAVGAFWEFAAFVANSIVFLLIGIGEHALGKGFLQHFPVIVVAILASIIARAVSVYGISGGLSRTRHQIEFQHQHVLFWGGLKGALSLALAIGLPSDLAYRGEVIAASFGVVAFSVIVQGLTMPALLKRVRSKATDSESTHHQAIRQTPAAEQPPEFENR